MRKTLFTALVQAARNLPVPPLRKRSPTPGPLICIESEFMLLACYRNFSVKKLFKKMLSWILMDESIKKIWYIHTAMD